MLSVFFYLIQISIEEIPFQFSDLVNKAINNSLTVIQKETTKNTKYPGYYHYPSIEFTLTSIVTAPNTNEIKGYSIDGNYIAIVKNNNFNLTINFAFIDPSYQKIYKMAQLIAFNDSINIYKANEISIFDIMTNFKYNTKALKDQQFLIFSDNETNNPNMYKIYDNQYFFIMGFLTYGTVSIDTSFSFNSKFDMCIKSSVSVEMNLNYQLKVPFNCSYNSTGNLNKSPLNELHQKQTFSEQDDSFSFLGYIIDTKTYINFDFNASNCQIFVPIDFETSNNYYIIGSKYIEITPYSNFDSRWTLQIRDYGENITSTDNLKNTNQNYQFKITFFLSFYYTVEFNIGNSSTIFNCGLNFIIPLSFEYDLSRCLSNYLYGIVRDSVYGFYNYSGYSILDGIEIIKPINKYISIDSDVSYYCFGNVDKVYVKEGYQNLYDIDQYSVVVENFSVYWSSLPDFNTAFLLSSIDHDCQLFMKANDITSNNEVVFNDLLPSQTFSTSSSNPTKINRQYISPLFSSSSRPTVEVFFYYKYWCNYVTNGCQSQSCSHTISTSLGLFDHWINHKSYPQFNYQNRVDLLKHIQISKLFNDFRSTDISFIPNDECNYSLLIFESTNSVKIDEKAEFSIKLSPKGPIKSIGKVMNKNDYISITLSNLYIKKTYFFNNIYVVCDGLEEGIISKKSLPVKTYSKSQLNCSDFKVRLYVPGIQNRKIKIGLDFHNQDQSHNIRYTDIDPTTIDPEYGLNTEIKSYTENTASFTFKIISQIPTNVKASNKTNMKYEMVTKTTSVSINDHVGSFLFSLERNEVYSIIEISVSNNISLVENDLILSINNDVIELIYDGMKKITQNMYSIPCSQIKNNHIKIIVRRSASITISQKYSMNYLIAKFYNQDNYSMNLEGQEIIFSSPRTAYAFYVPNIYYLSRITDHLVNSYTEYEIKKFDFSSSVFAVMHKNPNCPNKLTFAYPLLVLDKDQIKVSYNTSFLNNILTEDRMNYSVVVDARSHYVRYNDQLQTPYYNVVTFNFNKTGVFDFYAVCASAYDVMCEIKYQKKSNDGDYDLLKFPTRDGINLTERGMFTGFIYAPQGKNISYYKSFSGEISVIRSYNNNTKIHLDADDFENNITLLENTNNENITGYRQFCMKDDEGNNIPLSMKFIYNNLTVLMKHLGVNDDFNASQYSITDDDCFAVNFSAISTNNIKYVPTNACDLPTNESVIPIIKNRIVYNPKIAPTKVFSESEKFSFTSQFSQSNILSNSNAFTDSSEFSISHCFSNSNSYSYSDDFSNSKDFTNSECFSKSNEFSYSDHFACTSMFSKSKQFTMSNSFSPSLIQTSDFSLSSQFSDSITFSDTPTQSLYGEMHTYSMYLTYSYIKTVTFTMSYIKSYSYSICFNNDLNSYSFCKVESPTHDYFPYIIYSLSPSYTQLLVFVEPKHVKKISPAQLIGIVCGSCAALFAIVGIAIMIIRMKRNYIGMVENISETTSLIENHGEKKVSVDLQKSAHSADDTWL